MSWRRSAATGGLCLFLPLTVSAWTLRPLVTSGMRASNGEAVANFHPIAVARSRTDVLFGGYSTSLVRHELDGSETKLLATGDPLPSALPETATINEIVSGVAHGERVAFSATINHALVEGGVFRWVDGRAVPVDLTRSGNLIDINRDGTLVFRAGTGIFRQQLGQSVEQVLDVLTFRFRRVAGLAIADDGRIAVAAETNSSGAIILRDTLGEGHVVAKRGDVVAGVTLKDFRGSGVAFRGADGALVFTARSQSGGRFQSFVVTPTEIALTSSPIGAFVSSTVTAESNDRLYRWRAGNLDVVAQDGEQVRGFGPLSGWACVGYLGETPVFRGHDRVADDPGARGALIVRARRGLEKLLAPGDLLAGRQLLETPRVCSDEGDYLPRLVTAAVIRPDATTADPGQLAVISLGASPQGSRIRMVIPNEALVEGSPAVDLSAFLISPQAVVASARVGDRSRLVFVTPKMVRSIPGTDFEATEYPQVAGSVKRFIAVVRESGGDLPRRPERLLLWSKASKQGARQLLMEGDEFAGGRVQSIGSFAGGAGQLLVNVGVLVGEDRRTLLLEVDDAGLHPLLDDGATRLTDGRLVRNYGFFQVGRRLLVHAYLRASNGEGDYTEALLEWTAHGFEIIYETTGMTPAGDPVPPVEQVSSADSALRTLLVTDSAELPAPFRAALYAIDPD